MCQNCIQHGEGKKWYLQTKNYAEELLTEERKNAIKPILVNYEKFLADAIIPLSRGFAKNPATAKSQLIPAWEKLLALRGGLQIVLVEEVQEIFEIATHIVRTFCACRSLMQGEYNNRFCYAVCAFKSDFLPAGYLEPYPDYKRSFEVLTPEEAKKEVAKHDRDGMVHLVGSLIMPFVANICNCSIRECVPLKARQLTGMRAYTKGEYFARIDFDLCNGCRNCMKACLFGAIGYGLILGKVFVNSRLCYGCGLCRAQCKRDAILMVDRNEVPALANMW